MKATRPVHVKRASRTRAASRNQRAARRSEPAASGAGTASSEITSDDASSVNVIGDETARLAALRRYRILDTEPEQAFDDLTLLASQICGTPMALITLLDEERQWFKSRLGISATETARSIAFCEYAIREDDLFVIPDTLADERFRQNPLVVGEPWVRFYAGAPLVTRDGQALGSLCVLDRVPRTLTPEQHASLDALRRQAVAQLELRLNVDELRQALRERDQAEKAQQRLVQELRDALESARHLSALLPFCSACQFNIVIPADPAAIRTVTDGVLQALRNKPGVVRHEFEIELALQEALANAIRHGCQGDRTKFIQCCVTFEGAGDVLIVVRDPGPGFEVAGVPDPLEGANVLKGNGRGIFLINQLMDEVRFADGGRELHMRKGRKVAERQP
jgi:anti-sigma regulatory factor (Ser/Thr protein kinase)